MEEQSIYNVSGVRVASDSSAGRLEARGFFSKAFKNIPHQKKNLQTTVDPLLLHPIVPTLSFKRLAKFMGAGTGLFPLSLTDL